MRKEATIIIDAPGRDQGKVFRLREMPASQAEAWGVRLMLALSKAGVDVDEGFFTMGMVGVAALGLKAMGGLSWDVAKPLLDEMMTCVQFQPNPGNQSIVRPLIEEDIDEVATRLRLRDEVINLHVNFSVREFLSTFRKIQEARAAQMVTEIGPNTETSQSPSEELSRAGLPN